MGRLIEFNDSEYLAKKLNELDITIPDRYQFIPPGQISTVINNKHYRFAPWSDTQLHIFKDFEYYMTDSIFNFHNLEIENIIFKYSDRNHDSMDDENKPDNKSDFKLKLSNIQLIDIIRSEESKTLVFLAPGVKQDQVELDIIGNKLNIKIESKYINYTKSYNVVDKYDLDNITAKLEDGLLSINIPYKQLNKIRIKLS